MLMMHNGAFYKYRIVRKIIYMNERYIEKKKLQLQYEHLPILFTASAIIQLFAPYQSDSPMRNATLNILLVFLQYGIVAIAALLIWMRKTIILENIIFIIPCVIATLFPILDSYKNSEFSGLLMLLLMISFLLLDSTERYHTLVYFRIVWLIICVIGIFCFLSYLLSVPLPYKELNYYNMSLESLNVQQRYISYGIVFFHKQNTMIRLCGICNEPGLFGTISALLLCADDLNFKKKENWIILIATILSTSVASILIIAIYMMLKSRHDLKVFMLILFGILLYIFVLPKVQTGNPAIDYMLQRLTLTDSGLVGNNRSNAVVDSLLKQTIKQKPIFGYGNGYVGTKTTGVSTYKMYIVNYGILGFITMYGALFVSSILGNQNNKVGFCFIMVFFASIYQRPNVFTLYYMILLFGGITYIKHNEVEYQHD